MKMNITINKGTYDVILDAYDVIELLQYSIIALDRVYRDEGVDTDNSINYMKNTIAHLEEYVSSLPNIDDDDDYPCDIVNEF